MIAPAKARPARISAARRAIRHPAHLEAQYRARLRRRLEAMRRLVLAIAPTASARADGHRRDIEDEPPKLTPSDAGAFRARLVAVRHAYQVTVPPPTVTSLLPTAQAVDAWAERGTVQSIEQLVGVDLAGDTRLAASRDEAQALHVAWARQNVSLITTMEAETFDDLARHVADAVVAGSSTADLRDLVVARFGVAESRAALIARDQVAKLNGRVTQERQTALGVARYEWSTSGDERVRPKHRALDGAIRRWDQPHPTEGHPGSAVSCRCVAIAVLDDEDELPTTHPAEELPPPTPLVLVEPVIGSESFAPPVPASAYPSPGLPSFVDPRTTTFRPRGPAYGVPNPLAPPPSPTPYSAHQLPDPEPPPPPPPKLTPAERILHKQVGPQAGSNPGGVFVGADGVERYVKFYADAAQAHGEVLAGAVYRELGLGAPVAEAFEHEGRVAFASELAADADGGVVAAPPEVWAALAAHCRERVDASRRYLEDELRRLVESGGHAASNGPTRIR